MSKMSEIAMEIDELLVEGYSPIAIAAMLKVPLGWVEAAADLKYDSYYDDSMDGDAASALASAGWGTDEDYGCYDSD